MFLNIPIAEAQEVLRPQEAFSVGVVAGQYGYDFGVGAELGTPAILNNRISFRLKGTMCWLEDYKTIFDQWAHYKTVTASAVYHMRLMERCQVFVDFGTSIIFPEQAISDASPSYGMTSSVGLDMFILTNPNFHASYYFSLGVSYTGAYAEKLENNPQFGNGVVFNTGLRFYFVKHKH